MSTIVVGTAILHNILNSIGVALPDAEARDDDESAGGVSGDRE